MKGLINLFLIFGLLILISCNSKEESQIRIRPIWINKTDSFSTIINSDSKIKYELKNIRLTNKDTILYLSENLNNIKIKYDNEQLIYHIDGLDSLSGRYSLWHINNQKVSFQAHYNVDTVFKYTVTLFLDFNKN